MNYCKKCYLLTNENVCEKCGDNVRAAEQDDMCLVIVTSAAWAESFIEMLKTNEIPCFAEPVGGWTSILAVPSDNRIFVPYAYLDKALELREMMFGNNVSDTSAIGQTVTVTVDRPMGSVHPRHTDMVYAVNYGYVENVMGGDGDWQDAYVLGVDQPVDTFTGVVIAVILRWDDNETKWVVAPQGVTYTREEIEQAVKFQEKFFISEIVM